MLQIMSSMLGLSNRLNYSKMYEEFETICSQDEKTVSLFKEMRKILDLPKIKQGRDIYPFYIQSIKIGQALWKDQEAKEKFLILLKKENNRSIYRIGAPPIFLDFHPIIHMIQNQKKEISVTLEVVNYQNERLIQEVAIAIDLLSKEGFGWSFGITILTSVLKSSQSLCVIARNEQTDIVACVFGTHVYIPMKYDSIKVFHIWLLVRKANYPFIHFTQLLVPFEQQLIEKFKPDFLSLNVDQNNQVSKNLYETMGFFEVEKTTYRSLTLNTAIFMLKKINEELSMHPSRKEVSQGVTYQALQILGYGWGIFYMLAFKVNQFIHRLWYR